MCIRDSTYTRDSLAGVRDGLTALRLGLEQLEAESGMLGTIPTAFEQLKGALVVLRDGGDPDGSGPAPSMPGLVTTAEGLAGIASGLAEAEAGLGGSAGDLALLADLPQMMDDLGSTLDALAYGGVLQGQYLPGLSTARDGLAAMSAGLVDGVDEARKGEALVDAMAAAADAYTSFLGLPEGASGHLSFLFKLDGVSK
jgi:hypothetical protein